MKIANNKVVTLSYELRTEGFDSELVEKTKDERPLEFIYGMGMMIPKFETNLDGKVKGDTFQFKIESAEAYGLSNPKNVVDMPKSSFQGEDGKVDDKILTLGNVIAMQDESGHKFNGKIIEIKDEVVIMDFNHPMADKDLYFKGEILEIRDASPEELDHGHVHGEGHNHH